MISDQPTTTEEPRQEPLPAPPRVPTRRLGQEFQNLAGAMAERALASMTERVDALAGRLTDYVEHGGTNLFAALTGKAPTGRQEGGRQERGGLARLAGAVARRVAGSGGPLGSLVEAVTGEDGGGSHPVRAALMAYGKEKVKGIFGGGKGGKGKGGTGKKLKVTNIVESIDIGAPLRLVYDQWTRFEDFPSFMKKVEAVEQKSDEKLAWKAQVFWSHRTWESTIIDQVPDSRIIWRSQGPKGHVDGAVTFHAITPDLTRVLLVLEYHPQGFFEHTGNLWRAQGRRVRLELKHFRRHVMTQVLLHPDQLEGWRGEIRDGAVVKDHETALREERPGPPESPPERDRVRSPGEELSGEEPDEEFREPYERQPPERPVRRRPAAATGRPSGRGHERTGANPRTDHKGE